jgi:CubicO group peptidase (beta-lactamase class C family)
MTGLVLTMLTAIAVSPQARTQDSDAGAARERIQAVVAAIESGDAETFEAAAHAHFTPETLARRTPADRRQMVERLKGDFGRIKVGAIDRFRDGRVMLTLNGSTGLTGTLELVLDPANGDRISRLGIQVGGPPDEADASAAPPISGSMDRDALAAALDAFLGPKAAADAFAGVVVVARRGAPVYERAFGRSDRERGTLNTPDTRFSLGSINKIFTKTAIAQLVTQGRLALTDTLGTLLPDYPQAISKTATIAQLLEHQAGIADFFGPEFAKADKSQFRSNRDYYRLVSSLAPTFAPGERRQYCNGCYIVLGAIVEKVTGQPYEDYVSREVFQKAGMRSARSGRDGGAIGYTRRSPDGEGALRPNTAMMGAAGSAAGGGFATAADLLAFDSALRSGQLADARQTAWLLDVPAVTPGRSDGHIGVAGGAPGINAILESNAEWTVVVLANLDPPAAQQLGVAIHRQLAR